MNSFSMNGFQIALSVLAVLAIIAFIIVSIFEHFAKQYPKYSSEIRKIDERFKILEGLLTKEEKEKSILIMKKELRALFDELGFRSGTLIRHSAVHSLAKGGIRHSFPTKDMYDYAQGYFKCYEFIEIKEDEYVDYVFEIDDQIHLKMN